MTGYQQDPTSLRAISSKLAQSTASVEGGGSPPPGPEAGAVTGDIAVTLAQLYSSMGTVVEAVHTTSAAVTDCASDYECAEQDNTAPFQSSGGFDQPRLSRENGR
jgi:hypothetical protein